MNPPKFVSRRLLVVAPAVALLLGCAANPPPARLDAPVVLSSKSSGMSQLEVVTETPKPKLEVTFEDSPRLTRQMAAALAQRGFEIVNDTQVVPDFKVRFRGTYSFQKQLARREVVSVGKLFSDDRMKEAVDALQSGVTKVSRSGSNLSVDYAGLTGKLSSSAYGGALLIDILADVTGARGGFNKALVGDERGVCIPIPAGACDKWQQYKQQMVLQAFVNRPDDPVDEPRKLQALRKLEIVTDTDHERLVPVEMLAESEVKLLELVAPSR